MAILIIVIAVYFLLFRKTAPATPAPTTVSAKTETPTVNATEQKKEIFKQVEEFYPTGELKARYFVYIEKPDIKHGKYEEFYKSGAKMLECEYRENLISGKSLFYYENGQMALEGNFEEGKRNGKFLEWHTDGKKKIEANYKNGNLNDIFTEYYPDEKIMFEKKYEDGRLTEIKYYKTDGSLKLHQICNAQENNNPIPQAK